VGLAQLAKHLTKHYCHRQLGHGKVRGTIGLRPTLGEIQRLLEVASEQMDCTQKGVCVRPYKQNAKRVRELDCSLSVLRCLPELSEKGKIQRRSALTQGVTKPGSSLLEDRALGRLK